jgi:hypothetical protein
MGVFTQSTESTAEWITRRERTVGGRSARLQMITSGATMNW